MSTAFYGAWGAFWFGFGLVNFFGAVGLLPAPVRCQALPSMGFWFIVLAFISATCAAAGLAVNFALFLTLATATFSAALTAVGMLKMPAGTPTAAAGYLFIASSILSWYTASAMMLEEAFGRSVLPTGSFKARRKAEYAPPELKELPVTDPVCRMTTDTPDDYIPYEYEGKTYYFCSEQCLNKFKEDPARYLQAQPPEGDRAVSGAAGADYTGAVSNKDRMDLPHAPGGGPG